MQAGTGTSDREPNLRALASQSIVRGDTFMAEPTASIQLIVFGQRNRDDIAGVLRDVATAGFPAIEAGDMFETYGESDTRRLLDENGLRVSGAHFGYGEYANAEKMSAHIAYCKAMGIRHMMCSGVADTK